MYNIRESTVRKEDQTVNFQDLCEHSHIPRIWDKGNMLINVAYATEKKLIH